ncbi:WYL domain-containing protein [Nakamurella silvestris]|nr:WYL domain-containing protein [Nakamurella silvestris]
MAKTKAERLLNLVIALLNSERYRDVSWIRDKVDGYEDAASDEAFFRMFERDKNELRDLGIPLQTSPDGAYRIPPGEFSLPELTFTPSEKAALALAGRLWETTVLAEAGSGALRKINDAGGDTEAGDPETDHPALAQATSLLQPRVRTADPAFQPIYTAVRARRLVTFDYRKDQAGTVETRKVQPWGLVSWRGRWYVVGFDEDRSAQRTFRLSRINGAVRTTGRAGAFTPPLDVDLLSVVASSSPPPVERSAVLLVRPGSGAGLRRRATVIGSGVVGDEVFERLRIPVGHLWDTARAVVGLGPDAVVESPEDLLAAVVRLLQGARGGEVA